MTHSPSSPSSLTKPTNRLGDEGIDSRESKHMMGVACLFILTSFARSSLSLPLTIDTIDDLIGLCCRLKPRNPIGQVNGKGKKRTPMSH